MPRLESALEKAIKVKVLEWAEAQDISVLYLKFTPAGIVGYPDRIVLIEGGGAFFVEVKQKGKKPGRLQAHIHEILRYMGFAVLVVDEVQSGVEQITREILTKAGAAPGN